jgi:hypothetical protein
MSAPDLLAEARRLGVEAPPGANRRRLVAALQAAASAADAPQAPSEADF